jgi:hypothetical protein
MDKQIKVTDMGQANRLLEGQMDGWTYVKEDGGCVDRQMDRQMDGWIDRWMDGRTDKETERHILRVS